jgi:hypothetical protein
LRGQDEHKTQGSLAAVTCLSSWLCKAWVIRLFEHVFYHYQFGTYLIIDIYQFFPIVTCRRVGKELETLKGSLDTYRFSRGKFYWFQSKSVESRVSQVALMSVGTCRPSYPGEKCGSLLPIYQTALADFAHQIGARLSLP